MGSHRERGAGGALRAQDLLSGGAEEGGLGVVAFAFAGAGEAGGEAAAGGGGGLFRCGFGVGCGGWWDVAEEVAEEAAGVVEGGSVVGEGAEDGGADACGGVACGEPVGGEAGEFGVHGAGDAVEVAGEVGVGGGEGGGLFEEGAGVGCRFR